MKSFELILGVLLGAVLLAAVARRVRAPYPAFLALGGLALAFVPGLPKPGIDPHLILALFVAPVLLEAAYGASLRDLQDNWRPVSTLVFFAVAVTTAAVAVTAHALLPAMPWAAAIALGAIVAPPDSVAATAVLRVLKPPHRVMVILEGESLFNDATALLIYRFAVAAAMGGTFVPAHAALTFLAVVAGSGVAGWVLARGYVATLGRISDTASTVILQFVSGFIVFIAADELGGSGVVAIVVFAIVLARHAPTALDARHRIWSGAVWQTAVFMLNAFAFTLIGLTVGPVFAAFTEAERYDILIAAAAVVAAVIVSRIAWILGYNYLTRLKNRLFGVSLARHTMAQPTLKTGILISWCGMRGIVSVAAALALPAEFPYRGFILLAAFVTSLVTLVLQGLTLRPLIAVLDLPPDDVVAVEAGYARAEALKAAMTEIETERTAAARMLRREYREALGLTEAVEGDRGDTEVNALRRRAIAAMRARVLELRDAGEIGDDAHRALETEYDLAEMAARDPDEDEDAPMEAGPAATAAVNA